MHCIENEFSSRTTPKGPLVSNYRSSLRLIFRLMMSKKAFVIKNYSTLILSDETRYHPFWALCLGAIKFKKLISSNLKATYAFPAFFIPGVTCVSTIRN